QVDGRAGAFSKPGELSRTVRDAAFDGGKRGGVPGWRPSPPRQKPSPPSPKPRDSGGRAGDPAPQRRAHGVVSTDMAASRPFLAIALATAVALAGGSAAAGCGGDDAQAEGPT